MLGAGSQWLGEGRRLSEKYKTNTQTPNIQTTHNLECTKHRFTLFCLCSKAKESTTHSYNFKVLKQNHKLELHIRGVLEALLVTGLVLLMPSLAIQ